MSQYSYFVTRGNLSSRRPPNVIITTKEHQLITQEDELLTGKSKTVVFCLKTMFKSVMRLEVCGSILRETYRRF